MVYINVKKKFVKRFILLINERIIKMVKRLKKLFIFNERNNVMVNILN